MIDTALSHLSTQEKQRLKEKLLNELRAKDIARDTTTLSHAQQRLWVVQQRCSCDFLYHVPVIAKLPADFDPVMLQDALHRVVQEHPVLLSAVTFQDDSLIQHQTKSNIQLETITIENDLPHVFEVTSERADYSFIDVSGRRNLNGQQTITSPLDSFFLEPFELEIAPLFRFAILKTPNQTFLLGCFHHFIVDGWSVALFMKRLQAQYRFIKGDHHDLQQTVSAQDYFAYVAWEKTQTVTEEQLSYWRNRLQQKTWIVDLVTDFPRTLEKKNVGQTIHHTLSSTVLQDVAKQMNLSVNQLVLFVFQLMLARYSGQNDIVIGMPMAGRTHERWQETIGLFVNTFIHVTNIDYLCTIHQQLDRLKETLLADLAHAAVPFDVLVKSLYADKLLDQTTLFNIFYNFISIPPSMHDAEKLWPMQYCTLPVSKFDLSLHVYADESHLDLFLEFSTDLFDKRTITQMLRYLVTALNTLPHYTEKTLKQFSLACFHQMQQEDNLES